MKQIMDLQKAPMTPQQLREELCNLFKNSFIYGVDPNHVNLETREFELVIRARLCNKE